MKKVLAYVVLALALLSVLASCDRRGRVIPKKTLSKIYAEMFAADEWLRDHPDARKTADTTFFYDPIFKKYGYTRKDYDASVREYIKSPDKYAQLINNTVKILDAEKKRLESIRSKQNLVKAMNDGICGYEWKDFEADTSFIYLKSDVERGYSVRTD